MSGYVYYIYTQEAKPCWVVYKTTQGNFRPVWKSKRFPGQIYYPAALLPCKFPPNKIHLINKHHQHHNTINTTTPQHHIIITPSSHHHHTIIIIITPLHNTTTSTRLYIKTNNTFNYN